MQESTKISLKEIKEAIKQANANIGFEEINRAQTKENKNNKTLVLRKETKK